MVSVESSGSSAVQIA